MIELAATLIVGTYAIIVIGPILLFISKPLLKIIAMIMVENEMSKKVEKTARQIEIETEREVARLNGTLVKKAPVMTDAEIAKRYGPKAA